MFSLHNLSGYDVIYTSGNSESYTMLLNNIKGNVFTDNKELISICDEKKIPLVDKDNVSKKTFVSILDIIRKSVTYNISSNL